MPINRNKIRQLLTHVNPEQAVGFGGLAILSAASLLAFTQTSEPSLAVALTAYLSGLGLNVFAGVLQSSYQSLLDKPSVDEQQRLEGLAKALTNDIRRQATLRREIGTFLDTFDALEIAEEVVIGNPVINSWLLVKIYKDVVQYRSDFDQIHMGLAELKRLITQITLEQTSKRTSPQRNQLLFADDEVVVLAPFIDQLEQAGFHIISATDASQAIAILKSEQEIDLLVTDVIMPSGEDLTGSALYTGLSVIQSAREERGAVPIICLTIVTNAEVIREIEDLNILLLHKPTIRPSELIKHIELTLQQAKSQPEHELVAEEIRLRKIALRSPSPHDRIKALWALGEIGHHSPELLRFLQNMSLAEIHPEVKIALEETIVKIRNNFP